MCEDLWLPDCELLRSGGVGIETPRDELLDVELVGGGLPPSPAFAELSGASI